MVVSSLRSVASTRPGFNRKSFLGELKGCTMTTRTRSLFDLFLVLVMIALLAGIYFTAINAIDQHVRAAVDR